MYNERQKEMIKYLSEVKFARAEQLSERFQVSLETVRRDLMVLEQGSSIRKVRGGAVYSNLRAKEMEFEKKWRTTSRGNTPLPKWRRSISTTATPSQ